MKNVHEIVENAIEMESIMSVCCGNPQGDELPQVGGVEDVLIDVYSDAMGTPREYAASVIHHQYADEYDYEDEIMLH